MYAVVETGGKQYTVAPGQIVQVERLLLDKGNQIELDKVLLVSDGEEKLIGKPLVKGAKVLAESLGEEKDDKVIVFKYKPKVRYRRKKGHRHLYTRLAIKEILVDRSTVSQSPEMEGRNGS